MFKEAEPLAPELYVMHSRTVVFLSRNRGCVAHALLAQNHAENC
jgi:hypothetical protein